VRFEQYDQVFVYEKAEEPLLLAAELAQLRLQYPVELSDGARREYESFLRESLPEILFGSMKDTGRFKWLFKYFADPETAKEPAALSKETLDALTAGAADLKLSEISGILMDYRLRTEGAQKKRPRFEL
jgi:hypothetical protein